MTPESLHLPVRGGTLAARRAGAGDPLLLLDGGPALGFGYVDGLAEELSSGFSCVWHQQRGVPPSVVGGPYSVGGHVDDALEVLDALEIERAWTVGHSWGGYLAMAIAAAAPDRCLGYVAVDALGPIGDGGMASFDAWIGRAIDDEVAQRIDELESEPAVDRALPSGSMALYWHAYFADPASAPSMPPMLSNRRCFEEVVADAMRINASGSLIDRLRSLDLPAVFLAGSESGLRPAAEETAATIAGARLVIVEGAAHFPWLEAPGSVLRAAAALAGSSG